MMPLDPLWVKEASIQIGDYPIVYASLKGSRLYGTQIDEPGHTGDIDLIAVYQLPTRDVLSLHKPEQQVVVHRYDQDTCEGLLPVDLSAYELKKWLKLIGASNGNIVEALCVPEGYYVANPIGERLRAVGLKMATKRLYHFYRGYAFNQLKRATKQINSAKGLTAVFRESFFGIMVLSTGEMIFPFDELCTRTQELLSWESYVLPRITNTRAEVPYSLIDRAWAEFEYLEEMMDQAVETSPLPDSYDAREEMNELLLDARYQML